MKRIFFKLNLALLAIFSIQCSSKQEDKTETFRPVNYITVTENTGIESRSFTGIAKAGNEIELSFRESGVIQQINVQKGQKVKKGEFIAILDNSEAHLNYQKAVNEVNSTLSAKNTSLAEFERVKVLYEKGSTSLKGYQAAKDNYQRALAQYQAALSNKDILDSRLEYGVIIAPADGIIANTIGKVNERVQTGHVFAILNAGEKKKIELELPENIINLVSLGMDAEIEFSSINGETYKGETIEISPITSANTSTYPVEIEILNPTDQIRPGMSAKVSLNFDNANTTNNSRIVVPIKAVGEDKYGNFVYIINSNDGTTGVVNKQIIKIGEITANGFEVIRGLKEDQMIATAGLQSLLEGQKVKLN